MTLHAYCIRRAGEPRPPEELAGVEGAAVRVVEEGALALWLSDADPVPASEERLRAHDRVVRAALRSATPLPLRYGGARFRDEAEARAALRAEEGEFLARLLRVEGRVEMGIRIGWTPPPPSGATELPPGKGGEGRAYLEARRRQLRLDAEARAAAETVVDRVEAHFAPLGLPAVRTVLPEPATAGLVAHLVHRSGIHRYHQQAEQARRTMPEYSLTVTGPWAPYSFA